MTDKQTNDKNSELQTTTKKKVQVVNKMVKGKGYRQGPVKV